MSVGTHTRKFFQLLKIFFPIKFFNLASCQNNHKTTPQSTIPQNEKEFTLRLNTQFTKIQKTIEKNTKVREGNKFLNDIFVT